MALAAACEGGDGLQRAIRCRAFGGAKSSGIAGPAHRRADPIDSPDKPGPDASLEVPSLRHLLNMLFAVLLLPAAPVGVSAIVIPTCRSPRHHARSCQFSHGPAVDQLIAPLSCARPITDVGVRLLGLSPRAIRARLIDQTRVDTALGLVLLQVFGRPPMGAAGRSSKNIRPTSLRLPLRSLSAHGFCPAGRPMEHTRQMAADAGSTVLRALGAY